MGTLEIVLAVIAYSLGIASLILQVICYMKKMEYLMTILFTLSFLFLIATISLNEVKFILTNHFSDKMDILMTLSMLCLALTTPIGIRKERIFKYESIANKFFYIATAVMFIFMVAGYIMGYKVATELTIRYYMFLSIGYSMVIVLTQKPGMLVKHRDRIDKISSIVFFSIFPLFILIDIFYESLPFIQSIVPEGAYVLYIFFIYLSTEKLLDDIKRLTMFSPDNSVNQHVLARYEITPRESEVLIQIVKGKSYSEIAELLFISMPTVKTHISRAYKKMNINNKIELINLLNVNTIAKN
jgi:DNA-binding CsgD family transcriptional regulator